jgi:ribosomal protein L21E
MPRFEEGDRVRVDIPDETDADHDAFHGEHGTVVAILKDDAGMTTGDDRDNELFRVELDEGETIDFRQRDIRPPIE